MLVKLEYSHDPKSLFTESDLKLLRAVGSRSDKHRASYKQQDRIDILGPMIKYPDKDWM